MSALRHRRRSRADIDPKYLAFLRTCRCAICAAKGLEQTSPSEAAHVGPRGFGQRCPDRKAIALCGEHHRTGRDAHHVLGKRFEAHHGIDFELLFAKYAAAYAADMPVTEWSDSAVERLLNDIELVALADLHMPEVLV